MSRFFQFVTCTLLCLSPVAQETQRDVEADGVQHKFLTPGTTDTWRLAAEAGTVVRAIVTTREFDPTLLFVRPGEGDEKSVLLERDDEGSTSRFVWRVQESGPFEILVRGFEHRGGGNYQLQVERFDVAPARIGEGAKMTLDRTGQGAVWFEGRVGALLSYRAAGVSSVQLIGPDGHDLSPWYNTVSLPEDGEYFARLRGARRARVHLEFAPALQIELDDDGANKSRLRAGELAYFEFRSEAKMFRELRVLHERAIATRVLRIEPVDGGELLTEQRRDPVAYPLPNKGKLTRTAVTFLDDERYQVQVLSLADHDGDSVIRWHDPSRRLEVDAELTSRLPIGGAEFFLFDAEPGQQVRIDVGSEDFDPRLRLTDLDGQQIAADDDGGEHLASSVTWLVRRAGPFRLQIASSGDGGGGDYEASVRDVAIPAIEVGGRAEARVAEGSIVYWHLEGKQNQELLFSARSREFDAAIEIMDPFGVVVGRDRDGGVGGDGLVALRLPRDGRYTVGVRADRGSGRATLRVIDGR